MRPSLLYSDIFFFLKDPPPPKPPPLPLPTSVPAAPCHPPGPLPPRTSRKKPARSGRTRAAPPLHRGGDTVPTHRRTPFHLVRSSALAGIVITLASGAHVAGGGQLPAPGILLAVLALTAQIGRASCRERV